MVWFVWPRIIGGDLLDPLDHRPIKHSYGWITFHRFPAASHVRYVRWPFYGRFPKMGAPPNHSKKKDRDVLNWHRVEMSGYPPFWIQVSNRASRRIPIGTPVHRFLGCFFYVFLLKLPQKSGLYEWLSETPKDCMLQYCPFGKNRGAGLVYHLSSFTCC